MAEQMTVRELRDAIHVFLETEQLSLDDKVFIKYDGSYTDSVTDLGFYVSPTKGIWLGRA